MPSEPMQLVADLSKILVTRLDDLGNLVMTSPFLWQRVWGRVG